jgi:hypothetical protein
MEPWLSSYQHVPYNLGQSGVPDQTVGELLGAAGGCPHDLSAISLADNDGAGSRGLRESIAALYDADPDAVLVTTGASEAIFL